MKSKKIHLMTLTAMFSALVCVATMAIRIPSANGGYVNAGDCVINVSSWILPPVYSGIASGIGSMFADILSGYPIYAPATLVIKFLMGLVSALIFLKLRKNHGTMLSCIISSVVSEIIMVFGYLAYEVVIYHSLAVLGANILGNVLQSSMGIVGSVLVYKALSVKNAVRNA